MLARSSSCLSLPELSRIVHLKQFFEPLNGRVHHHEEAAVIQVPALRRKSEQKHGNMIRFRKQGLQMSSWPYFFWRSEALQ